MTMKSFRKRAAIAAGAAALVAGLTVGVAPNAQAAEQWGGIATGPQGKWNIWFNKSSRGEAGYFGNWAPCGSDCKRVLLFTQCGALAYNGGAFSPAEGATIQEAEGEALLNLPDSRIVGSRCNEGGTGGSISWQ